MERNFSDENFERFLRQNADGLRMRPSDKVWKGINRHLNKRRRRIGFILAFSLLIGSVLGYHFIDDATRPADTAFATKPGLRAEGSRRTSASGTNASLATRQQYPGTTGHERLLLEATDPSAPSRPAFAEALLPGETVPERPQSRLTDLLAANDFQTTVVDSYLEPGTTEEKTKDQPAEETSLAEPLTIESVVNSYKPRRARKLGLQFFFTPTVSYRTMRENKAYTRSPDANSVQGLYNIKNALTHKPDLGFQVGLMAKYPVSENFKLRGGVQFNISRYDIKTYNSSYEIATIQFMDRQTLNALTGYNNFSGYRSHWLENFYFQVAVPVGVEMKISGNEKTQLGVATTIQPTYLLGDQAYVISKDYKNYMEVPSLVRKWNVNASFETFVSYTAGKTKWQIGPQVRYQLLSSFDKKYPVKEHLFDFGLKVGLSLNNR